MAFQRTLQLSDADSLPNFLGSFDDYINQAGPEVAVVHGVPLREIAGWHTRADIYRPPGEPPFPVLLYLHGGGWVLGAPSTHRRLAADLAALGLLTIVVDYRRAPKHRFPAAVEDTVHAIEWAQVHSSEFGGDPTTMLIGGDSAGANLAAAALASATLPRIAAALFFYGIFDVHRCLPLLTALVGGPGPDEQLYLEPTDARTLLDDPRLHPVRYCSMFPPSLLLAGADDPLRGESTALAASLSSEGVEHSLVVLPRAPHGFLQLPTHPSHDIGLQVVAEFLKDTL